MKNVLNRIYKILDSSRFFTAVLLFFVFEAAWIAISAAYPQAFDENFHFGLIQTYSHYWLPFLSHQPPHADAYGAVARDPSYLYHYLMSFPYRVIALFIHSQLTQVILLRFINIGLLLTGLILSRRVLVRVGMSRPLANVSMLLFTLIPVVPQLAAQVNYDNMLIPLVASIILLTFKVTDQLRRHQPSIAALLSLLSLCILTSLVKYAFLPIFLGVVIFLMVMVWKAYKRQYRKFARLLRKSWLAQSRLRHVGLIALLLISFGMFIQRDGVNLVKYHTVDPSCSVVLNVQDCAAYSPWYYNYKSHSEVLAHISSVHFMNPIEYVLVWVYWMWYRLFFAVNGPTSGFINYPPLPLPSAAAILVAASGIIATIKWRRKIFRGNVYLVLLFVVSSFYTVALLAQGYASYHYTDVLENMNGRYLLPILLFVTAIVGRALSIQFRNSSNRKILFAVVVLVFFLQGGGLLTFISRSDDTWDVQNTAVKKVNNTARKITAPVIVDGKKKYTTSVWLFN